jgi:hypothetical protein
MLWLILTFILLLGLTQWIMRHVQGIGLLVTQDGQIALILYFVLILPGVFLHEISHALVAWLLRVRVRHLSIGVRQKRRTRKVALGSVDIARTDPIRGSLIGLAPLVSGCVAIVLISNQVFNLRGLGTFSGQAFWQDLQIAYQTPDFWLWAYLVFAIGNAMLPSSADRRSWGIAGLFLLFAGAIFYFSGLFDTYSDSFVRWVRGGTRQLTYAFAVIVMVDIVFAVLLFLVEQGLALLGLGRIKYR